MRAASSTAVTRWLPGGVAFAWVAGLIGLPLIALSAAAPGGQIVEALADPYIRHVVLFSLWQAILSTGLSIALAVPVAVAWLAAPPGVLLLSPHGLLLLRSHALLLL